MKAFILALLPGLEEETGEFFDKVCVQRLPRRRCDCIVGKVLVLLDRLADSVSQVFFMQNLWLVMITMPPVRGSALNFLSRRLPRLNADEGVSSHMWISVKLSICRFYTDRWSGHWSHDPSFCFCAGG